MPSQAFKQRKIYIFELYKNLWGKKMGVMYKVLAILSIMDFITTYYGICYLGFEETNPLINYLSSFLSIEILGLIKIVLAISVLFLGKELEKEIGKKAELLCAPITAIYNRREPGNGF